MGRAAGHSGLSGRATGGELGKRCVAGQRVRAAEPLTDCECISLGKEKLGLGF